jgi:hypothetical protein
MIDIENIRQDVSRFFLEYVKFPYPVSTLNNQQIHNCISKLVFGGVFDSLEEIERVIAKEKGVIVSFEAMFEFGK